MAEPADFAVQRGMLPTIGENNSENYDGKYGVDLVRSRPYLYDTDSRTDEEPARAVDGLTATLVRGPCRGENTRHLRGSLAIIDEAHSSQGGRTSAAMAQALSVAGKVDEKVDEE